MVVTWAGGCITLLRDVIHIPANPLSLQTLSVHIIASESGAAVDTVSMVKGLGSSLLTAYEKGDSEY